MSNRDHDPLLRECEEAQRAYLESPTRDEALRQRYFELDRKCREQGLAPKLATP